MTSRKRTKQLIDPKVQGTLIFRVVVYWVLCTFGIFSLLASVPVVVCTLGLNDPPPASQLVYQTWVNFWPAVCASLLMLPLVVIDVLRVSNRFAGPAFKMRRALRDLANGKDVEELRFREKDFWRDFADEFNRVSQLVQNQRRELERDEQSNRETDATDAHVNTAL